MDSKLDSMSISAQSPAIILVEPQLAENIGAAARAMGNFGFSDMRLVAPRDNWMNERTRAMAAGANEILDSISVFPSLDLAVSDLHFVYASTARPRDMRKSVVDAADAASAMRSFFSSGQKAGILFGRERWGLVNDEISLADEIITLPVMPDFSSLNLAQSVLLVCYEYFCSCAIPGQGVKKADALQGKEEAEEKEEAATRQDVFHLFEHLERELENAGFFFPIEKKPSMVRKLRNLLHRSRLSRRDTSILHGVVSSLVCPRPSSSGRQHPSSCEDD
ncbi:MAG: RNA methyltransferase [Alphaproteobacteria bacterium]|nr:RNA methyltransferase [Alphaproteobacteria bacterium]